MAKLTLTDIAAGYGAPATLNANNDRIEAALENTLSRDGTAPNNMETELDMDSNRIINLGAPADSNDAARWIDVTTAVNLTGTAVPALTGNSQKYLGTDGSTLSWKNFYDQTPQELAAGITPTDYRVPDHTMLGYVHPARYGFTGTVSATDTTAFNNASLVANQFKGRVLVPSSFTANAQLTIHADCTYQGLGRRTTIITKGFNGDLFASFPSGTILVDLGFEGVGATYTGKILSCTGTDGKQEAHRCDFMNAQDFCLYFETSAGSQSYFGDCKFYRYSGTTSDSFCAIGISTTQQLSAKPRKFEGCESDGGYFIDFGGSNNTYLNKCFVGGLKFNAESRGVLISGCRWANQASCTVDGHQIVIVGCDILPNITLAASSGPFMLTGNAVTGTITDSSTVPRSNLIEWPCYSYTPAWTGATTDPVIGNGTLKGEISRNGSTTTQTVDLTIGSTTTLGSGTWRFSTPFTPATAAGVVQYGTCFIVDSGTTTYLCAARIANGNAYIEVQVPGGLNFANATNPMAWANGDTLRIQITYHN